MGARASTLTLHADSAVIAVNRNARRHVCRRKQRNARRFEIISMFIRTHSVNDLSQPGPPAFTIIKRPNISFARARQLGVHQSNTGDLDDRGPVCDGECWVILNGVYATADPGPPSASSILVGLDVTCV